MNDSRAILLVDDSMAIRSAIRGILRLHGFTVFEAESGVTALAEWGRHKAEIGLVMTDVVMKEMDGLTLSEHLHREAPSLPIILLSGYVNDKTGWVTDKVSGYFSFLPKPFVGARLLQTVRAALAA
jgi:DNA-binding NtrC family response regulator